MSSRTVCTGVPKPSITLVGVLLTLAFLITGSEAVCKQCSSTSYASCLNQTAFTICFDGINDSGIIGVCPEGQVCTNLQGICKPRGTENPDCGTCNSCISGFSCISKTQFEYCIDNTPTGIVGTCDAGKYCSILNKVQNRNICALSCTTEPTCYAAEVEITPAPEPDYTTICDGKPGVGERYDYTYDTTCTTYIYCEELDGVMNAVKFTCSAGTYFSESDQKCVKTVPQRCK